MDLTLPDRTHLVGSLLAIVLSIFIAFRRFFVGCGLRDRFQPLPSHRFCGFGLKHRRGLFGANMVAWWLPWGDCGSHWCGSFFRLTYCAEATDSPLSIRFGETLEPVSDENLARGVHNSASFIVDTLYFLEQEMGNKRERRESNLELKIFGKAVKKPKSVPEPEPLG